MSRIDEMDLAITPDGDLIIENGDLKTVSNADALAQAVYCRLKSSDPEWFMENICANLEEILGLPNTRETGEKGEELIRQSLTTDGLISIEDLYVQAVPINKQTILFYVYFKTEEMEEPIGFEVNVNLSAGAYVRRVK